MHAIATHRVVNACGAWSPEVARMLGVALPNVDVELRDGEICVRGPGVFAGYHDTPDATAAFKSAFGISG